MLGPTSCPGSTGSPVFIMATSHSPPTPHQRGQPSITQSPCPPVSKAAPCCLNGRLPTSCDSEHLEVLTGPLNLFCKPTFQ